MKKIVIGQKKFRIQNADKVYTFVFGFCDNINELPELVQEVQDTSDVKVEIDYKGGVFIVSSNFMEIIGF